MTLKELQQEIFASKSLLFLTSIAGAILALGVTFFMVPSFQSRALVALGTMASATGEKSRFLEDPRLTVVKWGLEAKRLLEPDMNPNDELHDLVVLMHAHEGVLQVIARAATAEKAKQAAQGIADQIVADQGKDFSDFRKAIDDTRTKMSEIRVDLEKSMEATAPSKITVSDRFKLFSDRVNLENRALELEMAASGINSRPTAHLQKAVAAKKAVFPNWWVNGILGLMFGFFGGLFLSFNRNR